MRGRRPGRGGLAPLSPLQSKEYAPTSLYPPPFFPFCSVELVYTREAATAASFCFSFFLSRFPLSPCNSSLVGVDTSANTHTKILCSFSFFFMLVQRGENKRRNSDRSVVVLLRVCLYVCVCVCAVTSGKGGVEEGVCGMV
jgi:hypothetical protein